MPKLITVSGMIGAGKSTFIEHYSKYLNRNYGVPVQIMLEPVEQNKLLPMMYENPSRWTYTSQVRFLVDKLRSFQRAVESNARIVIIERDYKEHKIFLDTQLYVGNVSQIEYDSYMELYETCSAYLPEVLNYHIDLPLSVCIQRMQERGRVFESLATEEYLRKLHQSYTAMYKNHPSSYIIEDSLDINTYESLDKLTFEGVYQNS